MMAEIDFGVLERKFSQIKWCFSNLALLKKPSSTAFLQQLLIDMKKISNFLHNPTCKDSN